MEVNVLLVEGQTDRTVFKTLIEKIYGFRKEKVEIEGLGKTGLNLTYVTFRKDNTVIVLINAQDKYRMKDILRNVLSWANFHKVKLHRIGLLRDMDTNLDIIGWAKSSLRQFHPIVKGTSLWINDTEIIPFGLGNVESENPVIEKKRELELLLTLLAEKESTLSRFQRSLNQLKEDTGRRLKPKDIMHVLAIAKEYDGDSMSGLYRKLIEDILRINPKVIEEFLKETGLREFLDKITG
ncbi:DUF3226 domain-containing protein [Pyrococcus kukulkanii]|uniref:DUF3226 domain-containing protein n=1 Tax=Pyrococcus kukulkanii TaxID=1609559 RepID=UPI003567B55E